MLPFIPAMPAIILDDTPVMSLSLVGVNTATHSFGSGASNISIPSGVEAGDIIIFFEYRVSGSTSNIPSGFTSLGSRFNSSSWYNLASIKKAAGTESGTNLALQVAGSSYIRSIVWVVRPSISFSSFDVGTAVSSHSNSNPSALVIGSSAATGPALVFAKWSSTTSGNTINSASTTVTATFSNNPVTDAYGDVQYALIFFPTTTSNVTIDMGDHGDANNMYGTYCSLVL